MGRTFKPSKVNTQEILGAAKDSQSRTDIVTSYKNGLHNITNELNSIFDFLRENGVKYNLASENEATEKNLDLTAVLNSIHNFQTIYASLRKLGENYTVKDSAPKYTSFEAFCNSATEFASNLFTFSSKTEGTEKSVEKTTTFSNIYNTLGSWFTSSKQAEEKPAEKVETVTSQEVATKSSVEASQVAAYVGTKMSPEEFVNKAHEYYQNRLDLVIEFSKSMCFSGVISFSQTLTDTRASGHKIDINDNSQRTSEEMSKAVDNALENCAFIFNMDSKKDEIIQEYIESSLKTSYEISEAGSISVTTVKRKTLFEVVSSSFLNDGSHLLEGSYNGNAQALSGANADQVLAIEA